MKYEQSKNLRILEVFKILQHFTLRNAMIIKANLDIMKICIEKKNNVQYNELLKENHEITKTNIEYIDLHNKLFTFIKTLENIEISDIDIINFLAENDDLMFDRKEYFNQTIKEIISYNKEHPFYEDAEFRQELIEYYTKKEEYEKCDKLKNKKCGEL